MIVVSLLLILVAVTLLALGLAGGSSPLLISSIVASLLAAVALVVGARQAASRRRRPGDPAFVGAPTPPPAPEPAARRGARRRAAAADPAAYSDFDAAGRGDAHSDFSGSDPILTDDQSFEEAESAHGRRVPDAEAGLADDAESPFPQGRRSRDAESDPADDRRVPDMDPDLAGDRHFRVGGQRAPAPDSDFTDGHRSADAADVDPAAARPTSGAAAGPDANHRAADDSAGFDNRLADDDVAQRASVADAYASGRRDAEGALTDDPAAEHAGPAEDAGRRPRRQEPGLGGDESGRRPRGQESGLGGDADHGRQESGLGGDADRRRQESGLGGGADHRRRQEPGFGGDADRRRRQESALEGDAGRPRRQEPAVGGDATVIGAATSPVGDPSWRRGPDAEPSSADRPAGASAAGEATPDNRAGESFAASGAGFDDPDQDDPADEPPPQSVRPSDAVSVARMDAEVLVVDGRPRYHLAGCPHLVGRHTEPLPANEAVELGFSPCSLCRPVDRLVAQAARR